MSEVQRIRDKMDYFLSDPHAGILTGERRMGTDELLDMLAEHLILDNSESNIISIKGNEYPMDRIREEIKEGSNHILLYGPICKEDLDMIIHEFPEASVYRGQELCHQLPACVRESKCSKLTNKACTSPF